MSSLDYSSMSCEERLRAILKLAREAVARLTAIDNRVADVCGQAVDLCSRWVNGENVHPDAMAWYIDADEIDNPWMSEAVFGHDYNALQILIFITLVVAHCAHCAYEKAGIPEQMSESVVEAGSEIIAEILEYGGRIGLT